MTPATPYFPLIECDSCRRLQRHTPCGTAEVPEYSFNQEVGRSADTGRIIAVELWRCLECGNERVYGIWWA